MSHKRKGNKRKTSVIIEERSANCKTKITEESSKMSLNDIYSLRKRGNSYLIVVSMDYDCAGNRLKSMQQTVPTKRYCKS